MITLTSGASSVVIAPEIGGAMVGWLIGNTRALRGPEPEAILHNQVRGLSGFPLVPFSNRIAYGRFTWEGQTYQLARNFGDHPHTLHGVGWQRMWQLADVSSCSVRLTLNHTAEGEQARHWPFPFTAELLYVLDANGLSATLSMENRRAGPAPAGLGLHPYFPRTPEAALRFSASGVWKNGPDSLPSEHVPVPTEWDHANGKRIGTADLDNLFTGWDRKARITLHRSLSLELSADEMFDRLVVYTPLEKAHFCVEPVSHMTDAINRMDSCENTGLRVLAPGEIFAGSIRLRALQG